jgi:metal-responsive CopG/Arc/MetJ family transcriptional regulator
METMTIQEGKAPERDAVTRASVSFPRALYVELERIAKHKKVSVAWVVRDATEKYVADQWPLFGRPQDGK